MSEQTIKLGALAPGILFLVQGDPSLQVKTAYSTAKASDGVFSHVCVSLGTGEYTHLPSNTEVIPFDLENERLAEIGRDDLLTPTQRWIRMRDVAFGQGSIPDGDRR